MNELKNTLLTLGIVVDNDYLDFYCNLIENSLQNKKIVSSTQKHHIIPKY